MVIWLLLLSFARKCFNNFPCFLRESKPANCRLLAGAAASISYILTEELWWLMRLYEMGVGVSCPFSSFLPPLFPCWNPMLGLKGYSCKFQAHPLAQCLPDASGSAFLPVPHYLLSFPQQGLLVIAWASSLKHQGRIKILHSTGSPQCTEYSFQPWF